MARGARRWVLAATRFSPVRRGSAAAKAVLGSRAGLLVSGYFRRMPKVPVRAVKAAALASTLAGATLIAVPHPARAAAGQVTASQGTSNFYEAAAGDATGALTGSGNLYGSGGLGVTMAAGTSPSMIGQAGFGFAVAVQGSDGDLWAYEVCGSGGPANVFHITVPLAPGTSPSAALNGGGTAQFAWHGRNGDLWKTSPTGPIDLGPQGTGSMDVAMAEGTSPSMVQTFDGGDGYAIAVQGSDGDLWLLRNLGGSGAPTNVFHIAAPLAPGTSPAAAVHGNGGAQYSWHGRNGDLWKTSPTGPVDLGPQGTGSMDVAMAEGTSPSEVQTSDGGYSIAVQGSDGDLWVASNDVGGSGAPTNVFHITVPLAAGTSPAAALNGGGSAQFAWHGRNGDLWKTSPTGPVDLGPQGTGSMDVAMAEGTSPSLTQLFSLPDDHRRPVPGRRHTLTTTRARAAS
jgi:hypothetical protein